jgi:multidrug efflux pump subunit AcrA (membrane-fusion protein)
MYNRFNKQRRMKKVIIFALGAVVFAGVLFTGCVSKKQVVPTASAQSTDDIDRQIELKKKQMELDKINAESEMQTKRLEMQKADVAAEQEAKEQAKAKMLKGNTRILLPCSDFFLDKPDEYISGLGVSQDNMDIKDANLRAIQAAKADIESRFIGTVKSAMSYYSKDVNVPSNKKFKESELEGGVKDMCRKVVDKYAFRECGPEIQQQATGSFDAFAVYRMYLKDMKEQIANELEVRKVDFDKKKWNEAMDAELKEDMELRKAEIESIGN